MIVCVSSPQRDHQVRGATKVWRVETSCIGLWRKRRAPKGRRLVPRSLLATDPSSAPSRELGLALAAKGFRPFFLLAALLDRARYGPWRSGSSASRARRFSRAPESTENRARALSLHAFSVWLHVVAASTWIGSMVFFAFRSGSRARLRLRARTQSKASEPRMVRRFVSPARSASRADASTRESQSISAAPRAQKVRLLRSSDQRSPSACDFPRTNDGACSVRIFPVAGSFSQIMHKRGGTVMVDGFW